MSGGQVFFKPESIGFYPNVSWGARYVSLANYLKGQNKKLELLLAVKWRISALGGESHRPESGPGTTACTYLTYKKNTELPVRGGGIGHPTKLLSYSSGKVWNRAVTSRSPSSCVLQECRRTRHSFPYENGDQSRHLHINLE
jgi:hypothetical protein